MGNGGHVDHYQHLADRLSSEYEIVQDKIDKIGAFRFTIRGWTVTLVTGVIVAVANTRFFSPFAPLFLLVLLYIFASIERKQNRNQEILEDRAFEIEVEWRRSNSGYGRGQDAQVMSPWIAHTLRDRSVQGVNVVKRFLGDPDRWFYWALVFCVLLAVAFLVYLGPQDPSGKQELNINVTNGRESHAAVSSQPSTDKKPKSSQ
jgi:hypothetical protein